VTAPIDTARLLHLRRGGTSVVLRLDDTALPCVLHWGTDLGDNPVDDLLPAVTNPLGDSDVYVQRFVSILPQHSHGWLGQPGLLGSRAGSSWSVDYTSVSHTHQEAGTLEWPDGPAGAVRLVSEGIDAVGGLAVTTEIELHAAGLVRVRASVRNEGAPGYEVRTLEPALPVPATADELLDMTGRHTRERTPQRREFGHGRWARESWGGRPGHDSATVLCAGARGFGFRSGRVWGVHLAWSGNGVVAAEQTSSGWRLLRGGEILLPHEVVLGTGDSYSSPWLVASWGEGLDPFEERIHRFLRARPQHPSTPRPVILNTWEAVYFDHDIPRLLDLADRAADLGVERFVLDDGWFRGRRNDHAGLGDWFVDETVWPDGLGPLSTRVHNLGMQFGLWFEPEMVNLDSDLARSHPEWLFGTEHGPGIPSRQQHVLDLANPEAFAYIFGRVSSLVAEYGIDYIKWDHNRPLVDAGHQADGIAGVHNHTHEVYRLIDELKNAHPALEIESCCGGGGRIDLGIIDRTDRVWVSDCIDAHERQRMQRYTSLLLPPELQGTHVGSEVDHTTHRVLDLDYRAGTAIWGHFGIEWDLAIADDTDLARLREWIDLYKELRGMLHTGTVVHADPTNPAVWVEGVVAEDGADSLFRVAMLDHTLTWPPGRTTLPGLDPERRYRVSVQAPTSRALGDRPVPGWVADGVVLTGRALGEVGLATPLLDVDTLILVRATAID